MHSSLWMKPKHAALFHLSVFPELVVEKLSLSQCLIKQ